MASSDFYSDKDFEVILFHPKTALRSRFSFFLSEDLGLHPWLVENCKAMGIKKPTQVQANAIPPILEGKDVLARAKTGSGKTAATVGGAILGTIVGSNLAGGGHSNSGHNHGHSSVGVSQCDHIGNAGARSACERGVSERDRQQQRRAEDYAYQCGRYGRCDPNTYNGNRYYYRNNHRPSRALHGNALRAYNCNRYGWGCN